MTTWPEEYPSTHSNTPQQESAQARAQLKTPVDHGAAPAPQLAAILRLHRRGIILSKPLLAWSEQLAIGQTVMDDTHREFVAQLNRVAAAADTDVLVALDDFIAHSEAHFGQEEQWMDALEFPPRGCHRGEHEKILETAREVRQRVAAGDVRLGRMLAEALAEWFPQHATSMDAILALYMNEIGYRPEQPA